MSDHERLVFELFNRASELDASERESFLAERCPDAETRARVERMLAYDREDSSFLETPAAALRRKEPEVAAPGKRIGSYRIESRIASGGMGTVYAAVQDDPRRRVALKVLRSGWCDEAALRRFRFESEVLGRLRHPGIAQIFEAGVEPAGLAGAPGSAADAPLPESAFEGWPWFAMELVDDARPISEYAEARSVDERVRLFRQACEAVEYGHQRGIIHRDLKPSNLLVGGDGRLKVIDFGLATVREGMGDAGPNLTEVGALLGTPNYMSPEQFRGEDVDTRSDVYALGVVLHELLCGRAPFDFHASSLVDAIRRACTDPLPDPRRLRPDLPRELAWVLQRALAKEPERRYRSVASLSEDLERWSRREALEAGPPRASYRLSKFVQRNRLAVGAAALLALTVTVSAVVASVGFVRASQQQERTLAALAVASDEADKFRTMTAVLEGMFTSVAPERDGLSVRAVDLLDDARAEVERGLVDRPDVQASLAFVLGRAYAQLGLHEPALELLAGAHKHFASVREAADVERMQALAARVSALAALDRTREARELLAEIPGRDAVADEARSAWFELRCAAVAVDTAELRFSESLAGLEAIEADILRELGEASPLLTRTRLERANALRREGRYGEGEAIARRALKGIVEGYGADSLEAARVHGLLGRIYLDAGEPERAVEELERSSVVFERLAGSDHVGTLNALASLSLALRNTRRYGEAYGLQQRVVAGLQATLGPEHRQTLVEQGNLAVTLSVLGDQRASIATLREVLAIQRRVFSETHLATVITMRRLSTALMHVGDFSEARELAERAYELHLELQGAEHPETVEVLMELAQIAHREGRLDDAAGLYEQAWRGGERLWGPDDRRLTSVIGNYATVLMRLGRTDEAIALQGDLVRRAEDLLPPDDPDRLSGMASLASMYMIAGNPGEAERVGRAALELGAANLPANEPAWILLRLDVAQIFELRGRVDAALGLLAETLRDAEEAPSLPREQLASARFAYGGALLRAGRGAEAEGPLRRAHATFLELFGPGDRRTQTAAGELERARAAGAAASSGPEGSGRSGD